MGCKVTYVPLGELAEFESGGTPRKNEDSYWNGAIPWISAKTLKGDTVYKSDLYITEEGLAAGSKLAPQGSLLLLARGSGLFKRIPIAMAGKDVAYNQDIKCIRATANGISNRYLFYALRSLEPAISTMLETTGIGAGKLATDRLKGLPVPILDGISRAKVTSFADCIYGKVALNAKLNGYLLELAKARLSNLAYKENPLGMVSVGSFAATMTNGSTPSRKKPDYWEGGSIPWVKTGEVNNNLLFKTNEHITELALAETSVHLLPKNTVVMALYGSGTAGRLAILQEKATTNQACTAMVCRTPSQAFYLFLTLQGMYREIDSKTRGSVQQNLSKDIVASLMIPAVTEDLLDEIRLCDIYDQVRANEYESLQLASLRDALLPKLMSGEIDVSKVDLTRLNSHLA